MEKDNEIKGGGNSYDFGARIYDTRIGSWMSMDPLFKDFPGINPYNFSYNSPILVKDPDGEAGVVTVTENENGGGTIKIESTIFVYGKNAKQTAEIDNQLWSEAVTNSNNTYTYYDDNNNPWIVTVNATYVYTEDLDNSKTVNDNQRDISMGDTEVKGIHPTSGETYEYQYPGFGGSMIAAIVGSSDELERVSEQSESALGWGGPGGGLSAITPHAFIHEMFHGFGLSNHMTGKENSSDVLYKYGGGTNIHPIHFIDMAENILEMYNTYSWFENGKPKPVNTGYGETPENEIQSKLDEQEERKQEHNNDG